MRLKTYWHTISNLFTSPKYYLEIFKAPFGFSLRFFMVSMIFLGLTLTWRVNQSVIPALQHQANISLDEEVANYPTDLEIVWNKDQLTSSTTETIRVSYPSGMEQSSDLPPTLGYFIPEDITAAQFSEKLEQESLFVITNRKFFINNLQGDWTNAPLTELLPETDVVLNKNTNAEFISKFKQELEETIVFVKQLNFVAIPIGLIIIRLWMSFLEAILLFLFFKLNRFKLKFSKIMQLSLHLVVIAEIINQVTSWLYPDIQISMLILAYWSIFCYVFWTQKKYFSKLETKTIHRD
jgi:hypothetical protein